MEALWLMIFAGGWFVAGSLWIAALAFGVCILAPLWIISNWTEDQYIERSGWRFTGSLAMSVLMGYLLNMGGIPIHHYLFGTWWGIPIIAAYCGVGAFWSRHRLGIFLPRIIKARDEFFKKFCEAIHETKNLFDQMERETKHKNAQFTGKMVGRNEEPYVPEKIEGHTASCGAFSRHDRISRGDFMPIAKAMEPYINGKELVLPEVMLPYWESFYEREAKHLINTGLTATGANVTFGENKERIALWLFFWPSSMLRNVFTIVRDLATAAINQLHFLFRGIFAENSKSFKVVPTTPTSPADNNVTVMPTAEARRN